MLKKELNKKICEMLLRSCRRYFEENVPGKTCPEELDVSLQITRDPAHGDLSSNIAMRLARSAGRPPAEIAGSVVSTLRNMMDEEDLTSVIGTVEVKGGFINFRLSGECFAGILRSIIEEGEDYGRSFAGRGEKVNLEYVSANPTGPLTIAHGRQAAIGDALSRILRFNGYDVTSEYYLNDFGRQIKMLGRSLRVRYKALFGEDEPMPEDGYMGGYVIDIAEGLKAERGDELLGPAGTDEFFSGYAVDHIMALIRKDLEDFGVTFDTWTSQAAIEKRKEVDKVLEDLREKGLVYEENGAGWFASTRFGDDKDRVVVKSDGSFTYLAPDMAYHRDKFRRGFTRLIDLLGPDHHGYIKRMKAAVSALGHDPASLDILIVQLVTLSRGAEQLSMSTRKGEFVSLRQLIDELGKDVTRFFFLSRRLDSHLDFDIELAKRSSSDNPVYYIQYAHARICSIKSFNSRQEIRIDIGEADLSLLGAPEERTLIRKLSEFPFAVGGACEALDPNRLTVYLNDLAKNFHSFYTECRVISDDTGLSRARLFLVECCRCVLSNGLRLLNISLPEKM
jgi:arginyl-tRNA synthetase